MAEAKQDHPNCQVMRQDAGLTPLSLQLEQKVTQLMQSLLAEQEAEHMTALVTELMTEQRGRWQLLTVDLRAPTLGPPTLGPPLQYFLTQIH